MIVLAIVAAAYASSLLFLVRFGAPSLLSNGAAASPGALLASGNPTAWVASSTTRTR